MSITAKSLLVDRVSALSLIGNPILNIPTITLDRGSKLNLSGDKTLTINTLTVAGTSTITVAQGYILSLTVSNLTITPGSGIYADEKGYGWGAGLGAPVTNTHGASYGGVGVGNTADSTYGLAGSPTDFGSGGKGGYTHGGGAIRLMIADVFINDGIVSANGGSTSSGGSIYVTTNMMSGSGIFNAIGGGMYMSGEYYGSGGGGRVAIYYQTSLFTGRVLSSGGGCIGCTGGVGGDGTVVIEQSVDSVPIDTIAPVISTLALSPNTGYAKIGSIITLTITADAALYSLGTTTVNGVPVSGFVNTGAGIYTATYTVVSGNTDRALGTTPVSVVLTDAAGNSNTAYTTVSANTLKIDANVPVLVSAQTKTINTIEATFSEDIDGGTVNTSGGEFRVTGHIIIGAKESSIGIITLTLSTIIVSGETPSVTFSSSNFKDLAGNQAVSPTTITATAGI